VETRPTKAADGPYTKSPRTIPSRHRERAHYDRDVVHAVLDEAFVCHLGFVADGAPVVLPTLYVRRGERLYLHGSARSRPARMSGAGLPVCVTVTLIDGIVLARAAFNHSINYRSVVIHGHAVLVEDPEERSEVFDALVEHLVPGRSTDCRPPNAKELALTSVMRVDLDEVSAKVRQGDPKDAGDDLSLPYWAGVVPVTESRGTPTAAADLRVGVTVPGYLAGTSGNPGRQ
jgi:nitroimidazol reductase NimA-like FMN-containing flavoprotein (pyridoxamine 5'-phosphate oxidase superfamily)